MIAPAAEPASSRPQAGRARSGTAPLTPDELAILAVLANPDLKAARAKAKVSSAQAFAAGLLPDPSLNLGYDFRPGRPRPPERLGGRGGL